MVMRCDAMWRRKIFTVASIKDFNQDLIIWLSTYKPSTLTDELNYMLLLDYKFTLPEV